MGVAVNFTYTQWISIFPGFTSTVTSEAFSALVYPMAQEYCVNDGSGPVSSSEIQTQLLGLMCSHIAQLLYGSSAQAARDPGLVGRITDASEGSVSAKVEMPAPTNVTQAWLQQTQYGTMFWAATAPYRTMHFMPGRRRRFNPWPNQ